MRHAFSVMAGLLWIVGSGTAQTPAPRPTQVGIVEKLGTFIPLDLEFYDEQGHLVTLRETIDKPTIVTFVYYRCPGICSPLLTELAVAAQFGQ